LAWNPKFYCCCSRRWQLQAAKVIITNDGATILNKMTVTHPAAKMLVRVGKVTGKALLEMLAVVHGRY